MSEPAVRRAVLYVEDHPVNARLMAALLWRRPKLKLVVATTGEQALSIAPDLQPVLLLLDLRLPDCHGTELLPRLRQVPGCKHIPAAAVTAEDDFDLANSGFDEWWPKPLDMHGVLRRIDALTARHFLPEQPKPAGFVASGVSERPASVSRAQPGFW